jgi:hypothetical protein
VVAVPPNSKDIYHSIAYHGRGSLCMSRLCVDGCAWLSTVIGIPIDALRVCIAIDDWNAIVQIMVDIEQLINEWLAVVSAEPTNASTNESQGVSLTFETKISSTPLVRRAGVTCEWTSNQRLCRPTYEENIPRWQKETSTPPMYRGTFVDGALVECAGS